jgi:hypothetical protein
MSKLTNIARNKHLFTGLVLIMMFGLFLSSCKKENSYIDSGFKLSFSEDTIAFDTVFTTIGTSTQYLIVRNTENSPVKISNIYLAGGPQSNFRINVDGLSGTSFTDIEILENDSLYIFVEVTVDPNGSNSPMLITDSIVFDKNGALQDVDLVACGQDAYFILPDKQVSGIPYHIVAGVGVDTTWDNTKPIVVYGYAVIDSAGSLTINEGTQIYFHANSGLWSYIGGQLTVDGTKDNPVVFQGDRPEAYYDDKPGQWDRIWLNESDKDHHIKYAVIKNGFIGIQCEKLRINTTLQNKLVLENTIIENISGAGILSRFYNAEINNCVITNIQQYGITMQGGTYDIKHSTIGNYWNYSIRQNPSVYISNYYINGRKDYFGYPIVANFTNSIIYGNQPEEIVLDRDTSGASYDYLFDHVLVKTELNTSDPAHWINILKNTSPQFEDYTINDLHLKDTSPAIGAGKGGVLLEDFDGNIRDASTPDLGAFEFQ